MEILVFNVSSICIVSLIVVLLFPALASCQSTFASSRATYYGSPECKGTPIGACGYGEYGSYINGGDVSAVSRLYRNGAGCGACYQVRCKHPQLCSENGVMVVVTDHGASDDADFILSARAFAKLARFNLEANLLAYGGIHIEYRRISCPYPGNNLVFRVTENSKYPDYLALVILYQTGNKDIVAVEVWQEDCREWRGMRRAYGAVWDIVYPPKGPMNLRVQTSGDDGQSWVELARVIPSEWTAGASYESDVQLT